MSLLEWQKSNCSILHVRVGFTVFIVGDMIAMGSQNGSIYLFRVSRDGFSYKKINKIRGSQPLTHLDWSVDGGYLQTVTVDFDLLFCT